MGKVHMKAVADVHRRIFEGTLERPKKPFWTADCETDPFDGVIIPRPFVWGLFDGYSGDYFEFREPDCTAKFMRFVLKNVPEETIVYAHNGGKFDWHFTSSYLENKSEPLLINGRLAKFMIGGIEFRDSYNIISQPLRNFIKDDFDYAKMHAAVRGDFVDEISTYLESDCVHLWDVLQSFRTEYGLHLTQAGAAMSIWQSQHRPKHLSQWRQNERDFKRLRPFYYGGRVQCFQSGDIVGPAISVDINSAYPTAMMAEHAFMRPVIVGSGEPEKHFGSWDQLFFTVRGIARGCFVYKDIFGKTYYPSDDVTRTYRVTGWELNAAIRTKTLDKGFEILEYYGCEQTLNFKSYVDHFWNLRLKYKREAKADPENYEAAWREKFCKIFLNALYGKFGADVERYKRHFLFDPETFKAMLDVNAPESEDYFEFNEWVIARMPRDKNKDRRYYHVGTAASITGFVRAMLWETLCAADTPYYCDTDAICARGFPPGSVKLGDGLGQWEVEGRYDRVCIAGKKLYAFHYDEEWRVMNPKSPEWKTRSKGARLTAEQMQQIVAGQTVIYNPEAPTFSIRAKQPTFVQRIVSMTATDVTTVPKSLDPEFVK